MIDSRPLITIDHLVKRYGRVDAVRGIDLDVREGEVFGFLGPKSIAVAFLGIAVVRRRDIRAW